MTTGEQKADTKPISQIEAIDLKVGMVYRLFPSRDWATVESLSYDFRRGSICGVNIRDAEGGGCGIGAYQTVEIREDN